MSGKWLKFRELTLDNKLKTNKGRVRCMFCFLVIKDDLILTITMVLDRHQAESKESYGCKLKIINKEPSICFKHSAYLIHHFNKFKS